MKHLNRFIEPLIPIRILTKFSLSVDTVSTQLGLVLLGTCLPLYTGELAREYTLHVGESRSLKYEFLKVPISAQRPGKLMTSALKHFLWHLRVSFSSASLTIHF